MTQQRRLIVTGAASGIGASVCRAMAGPECAIVVHTRRNREGAEAVIRDLRAAGGQAELVLGDLAEPSTAASVVGRAVDTFGGVDVLISNAGFADRSAFGDVTDQAMIASLEAITGRSCGCRAPLCRSCGGRTTGG